MQQNHATGVDMHECLFTESLKKKKSGDAGTTLVDIIHTTAVSFTTARHKTTHSVHTHPGLLVAKVAFMT